MHVQINTLHIVSVTHLYLILSRERGLNISLIQPRQTTAPQSQRGSGEDSAALSGSSSQPGLRFGWAGMEDQDRLSGSHLLLLEMEKFEAGQ